MIASLVVSFALFSHAVITAPTNFAIFFFSFVGGMLTGITVLGLATKGSVEKLTKQFSTDRFKDVLTSMVETISKEFEQTSANNNSTPNIKTSKFNEKLDSELLATGAFPPKL